MNLLNQTKVLIAAPNTRESH